MDVRYTRFSPDPNPAGGDPVPPAVPPVPTDPKPEKTFKQEEVDSIVVTRLAKEQAKWQKKMEEVLGKFGIKDETEIDSILAKVKDYDTLKQQVDLLSKEKETQQNINVLKDLGVDDTFVEFVLSKVPAGEKFAEQAKAFIEANPKFKKEAFQSFNSGLDLNGKGLPDFTKMSTADYMAWRKTHNLDGTIKK